MHELKAQDGTLLMTHLGEAFLAEQHGAHGVFLRLQPGKAAAQRRVSLGRPSQCVRWVAQHRIQPWWMVVRTGQDMAAVPVETQVLLCERTDGRVLLVAPLIDPSAGRAAGRAAGPAAGSRAALRGGTEGNIDIVVDTGDPAVVFDDCLVCYVAAGDYQDPAFLAACAREVAARLGTVRVRPDKPVPDFVDRLGWCTWDAFYGEVSHDKVREGLASFRAAGVMPRFLILDDGWQTTVPVQGGRQALAGLGANGKFPGGLADTVRMAKHEHGIERFLVWHGLNGHWGGCDAASLPDYDIRDQDLVFAPELREVFDLESEARNWYVRQVGLVAPERVRDFLDDYHRTLAAAGVDGVKVDGQSSLEGLAAGQGGRVRLVGRWSQALEAAAALHLGGNLLNCMSCASERLYQAYASNVARSSIDFFPRREESLHPDHVLANAHFGLWFGQFVLPDWDMFHSAHDWARFHAVARAISGGPIYVSDKPGAHDAALLSALAFEDGTVVRCDGPGVPTRDSLFAEPRQDAVLFKVANRVGSCALIAAFDCRVQAVDPELRYGVARAADVPGYLDTVAPARVALYAQGTGVLAIGAPDMCLVLGLHPGEAELVSIVPVDSDRFVPIGLTDKLNVAGTVDRALSRWLGQDRYLLALRGGGAFLGWCERPPVQVLGQGGALSWRHDPATRRLEITVPPAAHGRALVLICW